jgi:hypothetical protein
MNEFVSHLPFILCIVGVVFAVLGVIRRDWRLGCCSLVSFLLAVLIDRLW